MGKESRKHQRFPLFGLAEMKIRNNGETKISSAMVSNIGKQGMGFRLESPVREGATVTIEAIEIMDTKFTDIIHGSIAWVADQGLLYDVGICFDEELDPVDQPDLYERLFDEE